jgi:UDP-N-acetylglucosamine 2-epimerase
VKAVSIVGARPQFIKAAMVSRALKTHGQEILVHTGQHYDNNMSQIFFDELGLAEPDVYLNVGSGSHAEQTGRMMVGIEKILIDEKPDFTLVYGDTNSTLAGALSATKLNIPVAHVEAGLRSFNRDMPEEINRVICDHISDFLFCPGDTAVNNLSAEGVTRGVYMVGDVMADAVFHFEGLACRNSKILELLELEPRSYALVTIHRAGNTDETGHLASIFKALGAIPLPIVFPVHPRTRKAIDNQGLILPGNVLAIEPLGYLDTIWLEANADCILTDSGGMQKEAYWLGTRCITLREETEWVETVELGWNLLAGTDTQAIVKAALTWKPEQERKPVYGDGYASDKITDILIHSFI